MSEDIFKDIRTKQTTRRKQIETNSEARSPKRRFSGHSSFSEALWPNEYNECDSIFSDIVLTDENDVEDDELQCTQKFINDIQNNVQIQREFDYSRFLCGSQYETREDIRNRSLLGDTDFLRREIQNAKNVLYNSENLFNEDFPQDRQGSFYGLPEEVKNLIYEHKGIRELYEWQKECLSLPAVEKRNNLLYALPTSGGKTLVAEILMLKEILCRKKNVLFILPYVSIVQEKVGAMAPFALTFNFLVEEYTGGKGRIPPPKRRRRNSLIIASIEKGAILFDSLIEAQRANEIGLIVVDELHLIGEKGRGATLESFLTKVMFLKAGIQIIGMSATIGNIHEISQFLEADVFVRGFRPVELKEYIKCGNDILEINPKGEKIDEIFVYNRTVNFKYSKNTASLDPDHLAGLVSEVIPDDSCLIFCSSRKNCENVAILLSKILPKKHYEHKRGEKLALMDGLEKICGILSPVLSQTIPCGVAYHHSGLTTDERKMIETAYRLGTICVICCTSTLAAGVNLPAKRVIIRAPYVGRSFITLCQYKQMVGRAGRTGLGDAGESILICTSKDNFQVGQMLFSPMDEVVSSLDYQGGLGLENLILSAAGLKLAVCLKDLLDLVSYSLLAVQSNKENKTLNSLVTKILREMFKYKILKVSGIKRSNTISNEIVTTQEINENNLGVTMNNSKQYILSRSSKFELTSIGKAAFKSGVDYKSAEYICYELKEAQKSLVLTNYTHLLYLIVCFNGNDELFKPEPSILFRECNNLNTDTQVMVKVIGITEAHIIKMARTMSLKGPVELQLNRLFQVLILNEFVSMKPLHEVAAKFSVDRGTVQSLITQCISANGSLIRLCGEIEEFWSFKSLFEGVLAKLDHCCIAELAPLLDLPAVKINRAKQLFAAGYGTIEDIARAKPKDLVKTIEHMPLRIAREIVSTAKIILLNKLEELQEETENIVNCLKL